MLSELGLTHRQTDACETADITLFAHLRESGDTEGSSSRIVSAPESSTRRAISANGVDTFASPRAMICRRVASVIFIYPERVLW